MPPRLQNPQAPPQNPQPPPQNPQPPPSKARTPPSKAQPPPSKSRAPPSKTQTPPQNPRSRPSDIQTEQKNQLPSALQHSSVTLKPSSSTLQPPSATQKHSTQRLSKARPPPKTPGVPLSEAQARLSNTQSRGFDPQAPRQHARSKPWAPHPRSPNSRLYAKTDEHSLKPFVPRTRPAR